MTSLCVMNDLALAPTVNVKKEYAQYFIYYYFRVFLLLQGRQIHISSMHSTFG